VEISSNGYLLAEPDTARRLVETGVDNIHVSLDSPDELHDRLRNVPGMFERVDRALQNLRELRSERDFYLGINAVAYGINLDRLPALVEYAAARGLDGVGIQVYHPEQTRDEEMRQQLEIPPERIPELRSMIETLLKEHKALLRSSPQFLRRLADYAIDPAMPGEPCSAGREQVFVFPFGGVSPCCFLPRAGNLKEQDFAEVVFSKEFDDLRARARRKDCPGCWSPGTHEYNALLRLRSLPSVVKVAYNYLRTG